MVRVAVPVFPAESVTVKVRVCVPTSFGCMFLIVRSNTCFWSVSVVFETLARPLVRSVSWSRLAPFSACIVLMSLTCTSSVATMWIFRSCPTVTDDEVAVAVIVGAWVSLGLVACFLSLFSEVRLNPGIVFLGPSCLSGFVTVVVAYTSPSGIPSLTVISALPFLIVVVEPISLLSLSNSLTVVVTLASVGMPLPTDTVTFCSFFPAWSVRSVSITGFCGLTLMVTFAVVLESSEYVPVISWVNAPAVSVFGVVPFHSKVGCFSSLSPSLTVTKLSISVNFGNVPPTVVSMVLPVIGCSLASFGFLVTLTLTLRVVTLPEPSSEVIVTSLLFMSLVTVMSSPDVSGLSSLPAPCLVIGVSVKPEILNFSI